MWDMTSIGIRSLMVYKAALAVTSGNISNANTPYYSRRMIGFSEDAFGGGVDIADVRRMVDDEANTNVQTTSSSLGFSETTMQQLKTLEKMFEGNSNIGKMITNSYTSLLDLTRDVTTNNRGMYLSKLTNIVQQFKSIDGQMAAQTKDINTSLQAVVGDVNQILSNIANINKLLSTAPAAATEGGKNPLLDEREGLLEQLAQFANFNVNTDNHGIMTISLSNGLPIVIGDQASTLTTTADPANPGNLIVALKDGSTNMDLTPIITGGKIAGYNSARQSIYDAQHTLGRLSMAFTESLNEQNSLGIDANGAWGANLFNDINSATAVANRGTANLNNTGSSSLSVSITDVSKLSASDYKLVIGASNSYVLTRISDNTQVASGTLGSSFPQSITAPDGFNINFASGTFNLGDSYVISPTRNASANMNLATTDPNKIALAFPVAATNGVKQQGSTGEITVTSITNPSSSSFATSGALTPPIQIQFVTNGGVLSYNVLDVTTPGSPVTLASGIPYNPATANVFPTPAPSSYDPGYRISLSGTIQAGDTFNLTYNTKITGDARNGVAMAALYNEQIVQGSTMTFNQAFNSATNTVTTASQSAEVGFESSASLRGQAEEIRARISGVDVQEEVMNLVRYQESYQASAQIISSAKSVFDILIGMTRR